MGKSVALKEFIKTKSKPISVANYPTVISLKISKVWFNKWLLRLKIAAILSGFLILLLVAYETQSNHFDTLLTVASIAALISSIALLSNTNKK